MANKRNKKVAKDPTPEKRLWIHYTTSATGGESEHDEEFSARSDEYREVIFHDMYREGPDGLSFEYDSVEVDEKLHSAEIVYLLVVRYESGDTFGRSFGNHYIVGAFSSLDETEKIAKSIEDKKYRGYAPWIGYFETFESTEIDEFRVKDKAPQNGSGTYTSIKSRFFKHD